jgi:hypothetical protein
MITSLETQRQHLIEVATLRPDDIKMFYEKHLVKVGDCSLLAKDAPANVPLLFRGKLRHFNAFDLPLILAGVDPKAPRSCNNNQCINPEHVL